MTPGELEETILADRERQKRDMQRAAVLLWDMGQLLGRIFGGEKGKSFEIYDIFPLWDQEEINKKRVEDIKKRMQGGGR